MGVLLTISVSCSDSYSELIDEEVQELPMTDEDDNEEENPVGDNASKTGNWAILFTVSFL